VLTEYRTDHMRLAACPLSGCGMLLVMLSAVCSAVVSDGVHNDNPFRAIQDNCFDVIRKRVDHLYDGMISSTGTNTGESRMPERNSLRTWQSRVVGLRVVFHGVGVPLLTRRVEVIFPWPGLCCINFTRVVCFPIYTATSAIQRFRVLLSAVA
jgi:hypothetical protein